MMQLSQVADAVHGKMFGDNVMLDGVVIDSRADCSDQLFLALDGERFNAHEFVGQAMQGGAVAALVEKPITEPFPHVLVADSHQALSDLATWWRSQFAIPVIGVTGSVGKTTVKEMLGAIFSEVGKGLVTAGNLNNEIGVPLTLLRVSETDQYAIIEMGMNHAGEISRLSKMAKPTVALINNAAAAHLEGLGTVAAVADAKAEIFDGLSADGTAIINADDKYAPHWRKLLAGQPVLSFGVDSAADVAASYQLSNSSVSMQVQCPEFTFDLELPVIGKHSVMNLLAAIAVSVAANIPSSPIIAGLQRYRPVQGRMQISKIANLTLIDDTYNANPASMQAAIEALAEFSDSTLIVGDMAELGDASESAHLQIGQLAADKGVDRVLACGAFAIRSIQHFSGKKHGFITQAELLEYLQANPIEQGAILVKGSRSARMENVIQLLEEQRATKNVI